MKLRLLSSAVALAVAASAVVALPGAAMATDISMWVRASGAQAAQHKVHRENG